jgi:deoxyhypusine synthase
MRLEEIRKFEGKVVKVKWKKNGLIYIETGILRIENIGGKNETYICAESMYRPMLSGHYIKRISQRQIVSIKSF